MIGAPGAGVILTTDRDKLMALFGRGLGSEGLIPSLKADQDIYAFSTADISNLVEFRASYDPGKSNFAYRLELIDPDRDFEERFLKINIPKDLVNSFSNLTQHKLAAKGLLARPKYKGAFTPWSYEWDTSFHIANLEQAIKHQKALDNKSKEDPDYQDRENYVRDLWNKLGRTANIKGFTQNLTTGELKYTFADPNDEVLPTYDDVLQTLKDAQRLDAEFRLSQEEKQENVDELNKKIVQDNEDIHRYNSSDRRPLVEKAVTKFVSNIISSNRFYLAFGVGEDLKKWSGPFAVKLIGAEMDINAKQARTLSLEFVYADGVIPMAINSFQEPLNLDTQGFGMQITGKSDPIQLDSRKAKSLERQVLASVEDERKRRIDRARKSSFGRTLEVDPNAGRDFNESRALSHILTSSVNIDIHKAILQCVRRYLMKACNTENVIVLLPNVNFKNATRLRTLFYTIVERQIVGQDKSKRRKLSNILEQYYTKVFEVFGLRVEKEFGEPLATPIYQQTIEGKTFAAEPFQVVLSSDTRDQPPRYWNKETNSWVTSEIPNFQSPLDAVTDAVTKQTGQYDLNSMFYEGNLKIIEAWAKHMPQVIKDPTAPVVIFGSDDLIHTFVYGRDYDISTKNKKFDLLHPDDASIFFKKQMYVDIENALEGTGKELLETPYGDFFNLPKSILPLDELSLDRGRDTLKKYNTPVFRINTEGANVLDFRVKYDKAYMSLLSGGFAKVLNFDAILSTQDRKTLERSYALRHDWYDLVKSFRTNSITQEEAVSLLKNKFPHTVSSDETITELVALIYSLNSVESNRPLYSIHQEDGVNPISVQTQILSQVIPNMNSIRIKTLPLFPFSTAFYAAKSCFVLGQQPRVIGTSDEKRVVDSFYSGIYMIYGWEHVISKTDVSSSFTLKKTINSTSDDDLATNIRNTIGYSDENNITK